MSSTKCAWLLLALAPLTGLANACSSASSDDHSGAGSANGGSAGVAGSDVAGNQAAAGTSGESRPGTDCEAVCARVKALCPDRVDIDPTWLSACKSACDARVRLTPDTARLEQTCVQAAATCNASIICVATPA
ncbi:MAG TPA: hypothetical protein VER12_19870 [Polyangiaceae bacterium]|nr:hypothetical protein [Polyangiaceae bacterium]